MATVKILYDDNAKNMEAYLKRKLEVEGPTTEHLCFLDGMTCEFTQVQAENRNTGNGSIHLIQSWSPQESKLLSRDQIHSMGVELINRFAPGHQYVVQTHTEEAHAHNHIVLNPVSLETGKRINNKLEHIQTLRDFNDDIARGHGLSVLPPYEKHRKVGPTEIAKRIDAYRGRSYIIDLAGKADFARGHATNYDEYLSILNAFDIEARIEPKNITYYYPGKTQGKRGSNLGPEYDKPGLESKFQKNWERVQTSPELKQTLSELVRTHREPGAALSQSKTATKSSESRVSKRRDEITIPNEKTLLESVLPIEELQRAKIQSIVGYCERNRIGLVKTESGISVLRGREHVEVTEHTWINHKNKTQGNVIDFVANHRQSSFLSAVAELNQNPRLHLLEAHLGESKKRYQAFHVPKEDAAPHAEAVLHLSKLLQVPTAHPIHQTLFKRQLVHVTNRGSVFFLSGDDSGGSVEYLPEAYGNYSRARRGEPRKPFFEQRGMRSRKGDKQLPSTRVPEMRLYTDPKTFLRYEPDTFIKKPKSQDTVIALFDANLEQTHRAVATAPNIGRVRLMSDARFEKHDEILGFFNELQKSLNPFSIETTLSWEPLQELSLDAVQTRSPEHSL